MSLLDILRRRKIPNAEAIAAEVEAEQARPRLSPWWNSKERLEKELGRKLP